MFRNFWAWFTRSSKTIRVRSESEAAIVAGLPVLFAFLTPLFPIIILGNRGEEPAWMNALIAGICGLLMSGLSFGTYGILHREGWWKALYEHTETLRRDREEQEAHG